MTQLHSPKPAHAALLLSLEDLLKWKFTNQQARNLTHTL